MRAIEITPVMLWRAVFALRGVNVPSMKDRELQDIVSHDTPREDWEHIARTVLRAALEDVKTKGRG